jgi:hypothetical protein
MGFTAGTSEQISLNDRINHLTPRERRILNKSWAKAFGDEIFPMIDGTKFNKLYCEENGRPSTPMNVVIGSLLLKELLGLIDEELVDSVILDPRFHYALHLTSYEEIPYSDRTPSRFRERLYKHEIDTGEDLLKEEIERLSGKMAKLMKIHGNLKRADSLMVSSSCKRMGRLELIYTCVTNLVKAIADSERKALLPEHLLKYGEETNINAVCYRLDKDEIQTRLDQVTADALELYEISNAANGTNDDFQRLERMLTDQTENGQLKPNKQIKPNSLQNPSDEEATFRRKGNEGHQGYTANIVEDCGEDINIITQYDFKANLHPDVDFCAETITALGPQEEKTVMITDGAFASDDNFKAALTNNIELVTTSLTGKAPPEIILDFKIEDETITACPAGHTPTGCSYNSEKETFHASFDKKICESCPHKNECPTVIRKKHAIVKISRQSLDRATYIKQLSTEAYKEYARKRNGVEGMPSVLRRRYNVDNMPVRGLVRSKLWFGLKIGAINIKRVIVASLNAKNGNVFLKLFSRKWLSIFLPRNSFYFQGAIA